MSTLVYQPHASPGVGALMRDMRQASGLSVQRMAEATGYTEKQVRNWEHGASPVKRAILIAWAVICDRDPAELVEAARRAGCLFVPEPTLFDYVADPTQATAA